MKLDSNDQGLRLSSSIVTAVLALLAFTVQWGVVTTKLDHLNLRMNDLIVETQRAQEADRDFERRLSHLEGLMEVRNP